MALVKYADSDNTKDPDSDEEKQEKGKKNTGSKGRHSQASHRNNGKRKAENSDFVANTSMQGNMQHRKGKPPQCGGGMNLEHLLNQPCPKHGTKEVPATHLWKDYFIMREFKNSDLFRYDQGRSGGSGPGFHGPGYGGGSSNSGFQNNQGNQNNEGGHNQRNNQGNQQQSGY